MNREEDPNAIELLTEAANGMAQFLIEALSDKEVIGGNHRGWKQNNKANKNLLQPSLAKNHRSFLFRIKSRHYTQRTAREV